jgi:hypothetical protein
VLLMGWFSRRGWLLVLAVAVLVSALVLIRGAGRRGGSADPPEGSAEYEQRRGEEPLVQTRASIARIEHRKDLIRELLAGRLTLLETAAHFRALDRSNPSFNWDAFRRGNAGDTDEERHCREVIGWVETDLERTDPCLALATCNRLEGELQEHLRLGTLRLPRVGD